MAYEIEDRCHREIHRLLTALNMLLKKNAQAWQDRIVNILLFLNYIVLSKLKF